MIKDYNQKFKQDQKKKKSKFIHKTMLKEVNITNVG